MSPDLVVVDIGDPTPAPASDACSTTLADVIARTRKELLTYRREETNRLANNISAGAGSMDFTFPLGSIKGQSRLGIDLEVFHVYSATGSTAVTEPATDGSATTNHAAGAVVRVNSRANDWDILNAVNDTLKALSSPECGLFAVAYVDLAYDATLRGYDLTGVETLEDIIDVWYPNPAIETQKWVRVNPKYYRVQRNADVSVFASGLNLSFWNRFGVADGAVVRVAYKTRYSPLAAYTDNVELTTLLHCDAHDLLWIGAAMQLADSREVERNQTQSQGEPRRAAEVPAGAQNNAPAGLNRRWLKRLRGERERLYRRYPAFYR